MWLDYCSYGEIKAALNSLGIRPKLSAGRHKYEYIGEISKDIFLTNLFFHSHAPLIFTSLFSATVFPLEYKHAIISPIVKKNSLNPHIPIWLLFQFSAYINCDTCLYFLTSDSPMSPSNTTFILSTSLKGSCLSCLLLNSVVTSEPSCQPVGSICHI